uniref:(California timema) hypothetical protein n=1 Tax=Timema californicum TaxID=61474 RepID=A0A7R9P6X9_TIMCA|nr:unnamed protein product [Timema californicum]
MISKRLEAARGRRWNSSFFYLRLAGHVFELRCGQARLGVQSVRRILRERRPVIELVPCVDLPRAGYPVGKNYIIESSPISNHKVPLFHSAVETHIATGLVREAHPITGTILAESFRSQFLEGVLGPTLLETGSSTILVTAFITKCLKQVTAPALLQGESREPELPNVITCPIRRQLFDNCFHEQDEVSLETLRLFEVLLEKPSEHSLHCLVLTYLNSRKYYDTLSSDLVIGSWSDEEEERERNNRDSPSSLRHRMNDHRFDTKHKDLDKPVSVHSGTHNQAFQTCYTIKILRAFQKQCNSSQLSQWELAH